MQSTDIAAIEIGSSNIKGAVATLDHVTGELTVIAREQTPTAGCVRYGWINNVEEVCRLIEQTIDRLESNPRVAPARIRAVYVAVGGRSLKSSVHEVKLRLDDERKITADTLAKLARDARESFVTDKDILDVFPRKFVIDSGTISNPIGSYSRNLSATYNIITCRPQMMRNLNRVFDALRSRLHPAGIIIRPLAEADLVLTSDDRRVGCAMVDVGSDTTTVLIYKEGVLRYLATIPIGSHNITRDIASLGVTLERAEAYKLNNGDACNPSIAASTDAFAEQADSMVRARAGEIVANIVANIGYADMRATDLPAGIVLIGGGSYLRNFERLLAEESGMKVRRGHIERPIRIDATSAVAERSVDILSALLAGTSANASDDIECLEKPVPSVEQKAERTDSYYTDNQYTTRATHHRPQREEDILIDDTDDGTDTDLFENEQVNMDEKKSGKESQKRSFMNWLKDRAVDLVKGPDED